MVAILATAGIVAAQVSTAEASGKPFVGIAITPAPEDGGGALIVRVIGGSAADGNLQVDDIITALDSESVDGPRDVVRVVREHAPGDVIVFSVVRDGTSMDVSITIGERSESVHEGKSGKRGEHAYKFFGNVNQSLVLSDTRYMTDDGVKTVRKAVGMAQNINADAGTFDLLLRDDSETLSFTIDDDTRIATDTVEGAASLSDLGTDATTMVVQVTQPDGTSHVQLVAQGEFSLMMHSILGRHGYDRIPRIQRGDSDGFSPQRFFFRWFSDNDNNGQSERRGRGHD